MNKTLKTREKSRWDEKKKWPKITAIGAFQPPVAHWSIIVGKMLRFNSGGGAVLTESPDLRAHPLATTTAVTIEMERDEPSQSFVTFVKELDGMSTFGDTEFEALEMTREMLRGYIESMEARGMAVPLPASKLSELKRLVAV